MFELVPARRLEQSRRLARPARPRAPRAPEHRLAIVGLGRGELVAEQFALPGVRRPELRWQGQLKARLVERFARLHDFGAEPDRLAACLHGTVDFVPRQAAPRQNSPSRVSLGASGPDAARQSAFRAAARTRGKGVAVVAWLGGVTVLT